MARQRRGGGFRPPELRGTLGTLLRTTLAQAGTLRDALERGAREGRSRLDNALSNRRRHDALAELGDIVLDLIRQGEIDPRELPEVRDIVAHLDDLDAEEQPERDDGTVSSSASTRTPPNRAKPQRVWRPPVDEAPATNQAPRERATKVTARERPAPQRDAAEQEPRTAPRKGGISFDDDDLEEYMHPDDVPPKAPADGDES